MKQKQRTKVIIHQTLLLWLSEYQVIAISFQSNEEIVYKFVSGPFCKICCSFFSQLCGIDCFFVFWPFSIECQICSWFYWLCCSSKQFSNLLSLQCPWHNSLPFWTAVCSHHNCWPSRWHKTHVHQICWGVILPLGAPIYPCCSCEGVVKVILE